MKTWQDFDLIQLVILPLFLFSGTFYPIDAYPAALQLFVRLTPLYQGVDLIRSLTVGAISPVLLVHVGVPGDHGPRRAGGRVAAARQAAAQVGRGGGSMTDRDGPGRADRGDRRLPALPAARRVARAGRPREGRPVPRRDVLGPAGARVRRSGGADPAGRAGAGGPRRQPDRAGLHRRRVGRLPVRPRCTRAGLADRPVSRRADDGLTLTDAYIAAAVRCAPPANKPTIEERDTCAPFLVRELGAAARGARRRRARRVRLGRRAPGARRRSAIDGAATKPRFGHGAEARDRAVRAARLVPPEPAEHVHRAADAADVRRGHRPRAELRIVRRFGPPHQRLTTASSRSKTTPSSATAASMKRSSIAIRWPRPMHSGCIVIVSRPPGACSWA